MLSAATARHNAALVDPMSILRREAASAIDEAVARGLTRALLAFPFGTTSDHRTLLQEELQALGYTAGIVDLDKSFQMIILWEKTDA